jgi:hypothetical protein
MLHLLLFLILKQIDATILPGLGCGGIRCFKQQCRLFCNRLSGTLHFTGALWQLLLRCSTSWATHKDAGIQILQEQIPVHASRSFARREARASKLNYQTGETVKVFVFRKS